MIQTIAIIGLFAGAVFYLGKSLYRAFKPAKTGCAGDCKCADAKGELSIKR